jgi:hypothetical protein
MIDWTAGRSTSMDKRTCALGGSDPARSAACLCTVIGGHLVSWLTAPLAPAAATAESPLRHPVIATGTAARDRGSKPTIARRLPDSSRAGSDRGWL